jgi:hypothetical protein
MASLVLSGDTSGSVTLAAPAVAGSTTQTLVAETGTLAPIVSGTAVASTSGTSIDFTSIPSWVKRITVMFSGVSTSGSSAYLVQIGAGSVTSTGYVSTGNSFSQSNATTGTNSTAGFVISGPGASGTASGQMIITTLGLDSWVASHCLKISTTNINLGGGNVTLSGTLDRVRITTVNGTDTFDAGTINILYE